MAEPWGMVGYQLQSSYPSSPPKVGFGVVCRCPGSGVQCLLQKRGLHSASPNKWSFPGGRLENPGDLDEDGDVGTRRELEEECGGGEPHGLPSLIHIECYKSGKVKQTIYHVYAVDTSTDKEWEMWKPKPKNDKVSEVDTMATELVVNNQTFPSCNGYCWVDMHALIQECDRLTSAPLDMTDATDLQHGLVRWVQNYGDHVLRTLIQRSPKLPHHSPRRHSSSSTSSSSGVNGSATKPRSKSDLTPKSQRYRTTPDLLTPPFIPLRPPTAYPTQMMPNNSPTHNFYGMGLPLMSPTAMAPAGFVGGQQGAMQFVRFPTLLPSSSGVHVPPQHLGTVQQQQQAVAHAAQAGGMMYHHLPQQLGIPHSQQQPTSGLGSPSVVRAAGLVLQGTPPLPPGASEAVVGKEAVLGGSSTPSGEGGVATAENSGSTGGSVAASTEMISKLMQIQQQQQRPVSAFHQVPPQPHAAAISSFLEHQQHPLPQGGGVGNGVAGTSVSLQLGSSHLQQSHTTSVTGHTQEPQHPQLQVTAASIASLPHHFAPSTMPAPLPPQTAAATVEHAEALLPIPHVIPSITPLTASTQHQQVQQLNSRKEILCRYFVAGQGHCPYGEKCWFAHLDPQFHQREFAAITQTTIPNSPLHIQVPAQPHGWNPTLPNVPMQYLTSPPQSPHGGYLASTDPSGTLRTPIFHPTHPYHFPGQPPILVWQPSPERGQRNFPLLPSVRPPLPVPIDPTLRFSLLSEVAVHPDTPDGSGPVQTVSCLATRADHFYVSFNNVVQDYKILFSSHHTYQNSWMLHDTFTFTSNVTSVHSSRQYQNLLLVGTEVGCVYTCTLRRGSQYGHSSIISHVCTVEPPAAVTSMVHFSTTVSLAQVVVVGTQHGAVSWYIAQPPQKTYSLLSFNQSHFPHCIVALQVWGGMLVSGSRDGKLIVWSMGTQQPTVNSKQQVHSASLSSIHIQDSSIIITVGRSLVQKEAEESGGAARAKDTSAPVALGNMSVMSTGTNSGTLGTSEAGVSTGGAPSVNQLTQDMTQLSVADSGKPPARTFEDTVTLWQYDVPLRPTKIQSDLGEIMTSAFYHAHTGNMFLAIGLCNGTIKILNVPSFTLASELHFPQMAGKNCLHMALNLSRESPIQNHNYYRNPFRDLILTTVWSDGKVMICQVSRQ